MNYEKFVTNCVVYNSTDYMEINTQQLHCEVVILILCNPRDMKVMRR
jgi:hypothetical protein